MCIYKSDKGYKDLNVADEANFAVTVLSEGTDIATVKEHALTAARTDL